MIQCKWVYIFNDIYIYTYLNCFVNVCVFLYILNTIIFLQKYHKDILQTSHFLLGTIWNTYVCLILRLLYDSKVPSISCGSLDFRVLCSFSGLTYRVYFRSDLSCLLLTYRVFSGQLHILYDLSRLVCLFTLVWCQCPMSLVKTPPI